MRCIDHHARTAIVLGMTWDASECAPRARCAIDDAIRTKEGVG